MMRLFVQTYQSPSEQRQNELAQCLRVNQELVHVVAVEREERITFQEWFGIINQHASDGDVSILANSDIQFDATISKAQSVRDGECYALARWENGQHLKTGADAWVFRGKVKDVQDCAFGLGIAHCDYAIAERLSRAGYVMRNPCKDIKAHHVHDSNVRTYRHNETVARPHCENVPEVRIGADAVPIEVWTTLSPSHQGMFADYLAPSMPSGVRLNVRNTAQLCATGIYHEAGWKAQMAEKLHTMQEMAQKEGVFVYLDCDVVLCHPLALEAMVSELGDHDIVFQRDYNNACTGVFVGRANERTRKLFSDALSVIDRHGCDQPAINSCLSCVDWGYLSESFWNYSRARVEEWDGVKPFTIPPETLLVHANWCQGEAKKRAILDKAKQFSNRQNHTLKESN